MRKTQPLAQGASHRRLVGAALIPAALLVAAACGSSSKTTATKSTSPTTAAPAASTQGVTIATADVTGVGTVLVNAKDGRTLYLLTSEQGGKLTCTDENGCTKVWPDTELPSGVSAATAGSGVQASLLGTVKSADGNLYVTYASYPLYEFAHDTAAGQANGQGITSFGGTWWAVSPSGAPVTAKATSAPATTRAGGY